MGDGSEHIPWDYTLDDKQQAAYEKAKKQHDEEGYVDLDDYPELKEIPDLVYDEIEEQEMDSISMYADDDEYVREALGLDLMDPDDINELVHSGNSNVLEYFGLTGKSEEELIDWDANDLDEDDLPCVRDLDPDFEPEYPYTLTVYLDPDDLLDD